MNYETIKQLAKETGRRVPDLLALAPQNDPFYQAPFQQEAAQWFADVWRKHGVPKGVHIRRIHYWLVTQATPFKLPDGSDYVNTPKCWNWLDSASLSARYLGLISSDAFIDRRNPNPEVNHQTCTEPDPEPDISQFDSWHEYNLPGLPELRDLPRSLPDLPSFEATSLPYICEQPYMVEVWCEKTTMNDILSPLCRQYKVNFVTGAGEMSETACYRFLRRVLNAGKPCRILYISDFDPAGIGMPVSVTRKIEFHQRDRSKPEFHDLDVKLEPIILTAEQVDEYGLPRIPVNDKDVRKGRFEERNGEGQVELDALEAVRPGELARIVTDAILQYRDEELPDRVQEAYDEYESYLLDETDKIQSEYSDRQEEAETEYQALREEWHAIREEFAGLTETFRPRVEALRGRFDAIQRQAKEIHDDALEECQTQVANLNSFDRPDAELPDEPEDQLYESWRDYGEQLEAYKRHKNGDNGE